ncbi:helix-turn-helix domain-containing protein [Epilithonimonas arachidiradicis]|uniref:Helix-turn-helix protein n=1 Tax=Epilithonimonas arachidiradicis TaxID=1617282 RepID=A0A420CXW5_9FLAO|nr:helix-turn-helix transcriptional regulator [Epilithonimonas arachidiradicis]RKE83095.1 helix-turn-helix protein [Epilithonimonas arachidiradicis]GGG64945.1 transcriptional regulator [Epilithonimonas arachidiradicis]
MEFNDRITKVIEYTELTPAEFAEDINVQRSSISHIISGRNKPSLDFITKIKAKFPELEWEWLITGSGEMLVNKEENSTAVTIPEPEDSKPAKKSLPDLFSLIDDDNFGKEEIKEKPEKANSRESNIPAHNPDKNKIADSQPLENSDTKQENPLKKIRRIVFFYEDGTFETFQN